MRDYRKEHLRRKSEEATRQAEERQQAIARRSRGISATLLALVVMAVVAILVVVPMRFSAFADNEVDPVEAYLTENVDENITEAESEVDAQARVTVESTGLMALAESMANGIDDLQPADRAIPTKITLADASITPEDATISGMYGDDNNIDWFIAQYQSILPLMTTGDDSAYYVALLDNAKFNQYGQATDVVFAKNNDDGEVIDDILYDKETGIAYIPKYYFDNLDALDEAASDDAAAIVATTSEAIAADGQEVAEAPAVAQEEIAQADAAPVEPGIQDAPEQETAAAGSAALESDAVGAPVANPTDQQPTELSAAAEPVLAGTEPTDTSETPADEVATDEELQLASDLNTVLAEELFPVQAQLLIRYNWGGPTGETVYEDEVGQEVPVDNVNIPISVASEDPQVQVTGIDHVNAPGFDLSVTIPVVTPETATAADLSRMAIYEGGSDTPLTIDYDTMTYDNQTGELTLPLNPMTVSSLTIRVLTPDAMQALLDSLLPAETAMALTDAQAAKNIAKAWPGKLTKMTRQAFLARKGKLSTYDANIGYENRYTPQSWRNAMWAAVPYMYAGPEGYGSDNALVGKILEGHFDWDTYGSGYGIYYTYQGFANLYQSGSMKSSSGTGHDLMATSARTSVQNGGSVTGVLGLPGNSGSPISIDGLDFTGLDRVGGNELMVSGTCSHIARSYGTGGMPQYASGPYHEAAFRPLYIADDSSYVIIGFASNIDVGQTFGGVYKFNMQSTGKAHVKKASSEANFTNQYPASYAKNCSGAVFGIYSSKEAADAAVPTGDPNGRAANYGSPVKTVTIGENGLSESVTLNPGKYYARELKAPTGFKLNMATSDAKDVPAGGEAEFTFQDDPYTVDISVHKKDAETNNAIKQGRFTFALCDANKGELGRKTAEGTDVVSWTHMPLGTYFVHEVEATYPYQVNGEYFPVNATEATPTVDVSVKDTQRRGKVSLTKTDSGDNNPLEGVTFTLTSKQDVTSLDGTKRHSNGQLVTVKKTGDGTYEFDPNSKETALKTNKAGQVSVSRLYLTTGNTTFQFNETATIDGHIINRNPVDVTIAKDESTAEPAATGALGNNPNYIDIYKTALKDGTPVAGTTIGFWKSADDVKVAPDEGSDSIAIRTPDGTDAYRPVIVRNDTLGTVRGETANADGSYIVLKGKSAGVADKEYRLFNDGGDASEVPEGKGSGEETQAEATSEEVEGSAAPANTDEPIADAPADDAGDAAGDDKRAAEPGAASCTISVKPGIYEITLRSADGDILATLPEDQSVVGTTVSLNLTAEGRKLTAENGDPASANATVEWDASQNAWVAKDLAAGSVYRIQIGDQTLKNLSTSETGGVTHYGRYADAASTWYNAGWTDQAALPKSDASIMTGATISNKAYAYDTVTDAQGHIHVERIPFGSYVLAEVKPYVDPVYHKAYLADGIAHHFTVKDKEGTISDTDNLDDGYHEGNEAAFTDSKKFAFKNDVTKLNISKREVTGGPEIPGALLTLTGDDNTIIDEWTSTEEPHYIEGLQPGIYTLTERMTPNNYDQAESIQFRLFPTGDIQHVEMLDSPISIDAEIDKRQEIAKPLNERHAENGDGKNNAKVSESKCGNYDYSIDFRSTSNTWTDEFTVEDPLEVVSAGMARLYEVDTPQAWQDFDGKMNVWYRTNLDEGLPADTGVESSGQAPLGFSVEIDRGGAQTKMTDEEIEEFEGLTVSIAGHKVTAFDPAFADYLVQCYDEDDQSIYSEPVFSGLPEGWTATVEPKTEGGTDEEDADEEAADDKNSADAADDKNSANGEETEQTPAAATAAKQVVGNTVTLTKGKGDDAKSYEFNFVGSVKEDTRTPEEKTLEYNARKDGANATLTDGHVNPWLADVRVMKNDTDHDGRIIAFDGWHLWESDLSTMVTTRLSIDDLPLGAGEYVTAIRFEYGRVEDGFTTRPDEWDRALLKDEHDDLDDIPSVADRTFEAADAATPATLTALDALVDTLTTEASKTAEQDIRARNEEEAAQYEKLLAEIAEYNDARGEESSLPEKYIQAKFAPAFEGDDDDATQIAAARDAAKLSVQAAFEASDSAEGRITLRKSLVSLRSVISGQVSDETRNAYDEALLAFESTYLVNDPEGYANATATLMGTIGQAIDEIAANGLAGRIHYAPAVLRMYVTSKYVPDTELRNSAKVDAYRNGGDGDDEDKEHKKLEGHDRDEVVQTAKEREIEIGTTLAKQDGAKEIVRNIDNLDPSAQILLIDVVDYKGLTPGKTYVMKGELHLRYGVNGDHMDAGILATGNSDEAVVGTAVFTPESEDGSVEIPFTFYDRDLTAKGVEATDNPENFALVAFEELYIQFAPDTTSDYTLAEHKDIDDEAQTVNVHNVTDLDYDVVSNGFFRPSTPLAQTGDPVVIAAIAVIAAGAVIGFIVWRKRHSA